MVGSHDGAGVRGVGRDRERGVRAQAVVEVVEVEYDSAILTKIMTAAGQYRYSKSPYQPSKTLSDGRPYEAWRLRPLPSGSVGLGG